MTLPDLCTVACSLTVMCLGSLWPAISALYRKSRKWKKAMKSSWNSKMRWEGELCFHSMSYVVWSKTATMSSHLADPWKIDLLVKLCKPRREIVNLFHWGSDQATWPGVAPPELWFGDFFSVVWPWQELTALREAHEGEIEKLKAVSNRSSSSTFSSSFWEKKASMSSKCKNGTVGHFWRNWVFHGKSKLGMWVILMQCFKTIVAR